VAAGGGGYHQQQQQQHQAGSGSVHWQAPAELVMKQEPTRYASLHLLT
jgi:hypothetical protein